MKFSDIIGNEHIKENLRNIIDADKIPHAILISAPKGISKLPLARATTQYIHCTNRINGDSCGMCPSCLQHQSYNHADTFFIFPVVKKGGKSTDSDDLITEWREFISKHPNES
ncbi:MAG: DNA polymerase III subunit delta, partial [Bacteroidales bacterium]